MANLSVLSPGKWILDIFGKNIFRFFIFFAVSTFLKKIRSGPLTLARQGSILAGAPTVQMDGVITTEKSMAPQSQGQHLHLATYDKPAHLIEE